MKTYTKVLNKVIRKAITMGLQVVYSDDLDEYFKGDLDGKTVWLTDMNDDEELFNLLHLIGHNIQWCIDPVLEKLGNRSYKNPGPRILKRLQEYEWEANCYALEILHQVKVKKLDDWLFSMYTKDQYYLTHFYKTGEKIKYISDYARDNTVIRPLVPKAIPEVVFREFSKNRNGIVI